MSKQTLNVLFKKMQRDDKKDVLKFEIRSKSKEEKVKSPQAIQEMVGEMVNIEIEGTKCGPVSAELAKANNDGKKVVLDLNLKGDNADKAAGIFLMAGSDVTLHIEPAQTSLLEEKPKNDHEGVEYAVDVTTGSVLSYNERMKKEQEGAASDPVEEEKEEVEISENDDEEFGDDLEEDDLKPVDDDELPF
ncbi:hypothetical protein RYX56_05470 [Alkalihalophilus lindianensis]|uniref:Uncharacterized protein n=1 Tax=Alkalihalophilus lindianensis TaxID=1630542 RepID=A0ABU3X922_9BACI|nr:hypothetical protein [Alkalihalophilus lindianensis]MDV2683757.1 hypothetical protein [Alkalihalophilus lindianensis]MDV2683823.1 hypothetical protein [Alkalihalophilus lindianensis]